MNIYCCHPTVPGCDVMYAAFAGPCAGQAASHGICMDSLCYHGFSFGIALWDKGLFHSEAMSRLFCPTCHGTCSPIPPWGCRGPAVHMQPSLAPSGLIPLFPGELPGTLTRAVPVPTSLLIPSLQPQALRRLVAALPSAIWPSLHQCQWLGSAPLQGKGTKSQGNGKWLTWSRVHPAPSG